MTERYMEKQIVRRSELNKDEYFKYVMHELIRFKSREYYREKSIRIIHT